MEPIDIQNYREGTRSKDSTMSGVMSPSFICKACKGHKPIKGRKALVKGTSRYGYVCGDCKETKK